MFHLGYTLEDLLKDSEDALDHQTEKFRSEVLEDLEDNGVGYTEGYLVLADTQNSDPHTLGVLNALTNSIR